MYFSLSLTFKLGIFDSKIQVYLHTLAVNHVIEHYLEMRLI